MDEARLAGDAARLAQFCAATVDNTLCVSEIAASVERRFGAVCAVYMLDCSSCEYRRIGGSDHFPSVYASPQAALMPALKAMRGHTCVALLKLSKDLEPATGLTTAYEATVMAILAFLYGRQFTQTLLSESHSPIDFHQTNAAFFDNLKLVTAVSSNMYAGALRELDTESGTLRTLFVWNAGLASDIPLFSWDIAVGSSRVDLQACKLEYSIVSPK